MSVCAFVLFVCVMCEVLGNLCFDFSQLRLFKLMNHVFLCFCFFLFIYK